MAADFAVIAMSKRKIDAGAAFDLAILGPAAIDDLIGQGKIVPATRTSFGRTGLGVVIGKSAPNPDIATPEAFKRTMLAAKTVGHSKEGLSGVHFLAALDRLAHGGDEAEATHLRGRWPHPRHCFRRGGDRRNRDRAESRDGGGAIRWPLTARNPDLRGLHRRDQHGRQGSGGNPGLPAIPEGTGCGRGVPGKGHGAGLRLQTLPEREPRIGALESSWSSNLKTAKALGLDI